MWGLEHAWLCASGMKIIVSFSLQKRRKGKQPGPCLWGNQHMHRAATLVSWASALSSREQIYSFGAAWWFSSSQQNLFRGGGFDMVKEHSTMIYFLKSWIWNSLTIWHIQMFLLPPIRKKYKCKSFATPFFINTIYVRILRVFMKKCWYHHGGRLEFRR